MTYLMLGLIIFLGAHSVRIFAEDWRTRTIARVGQNPWKGVYSLISIAGFVLLVWAVVDFIAARKRDRSAGTRYPAGSGRACLQDGLPE